MRSIVLLAGVASFVVALGCASAPLRTEGSSSAIRAAEENGAGDVPRAALHLQLAKESLDKATRLQKDGDEDEAESLLTRAEADAELAVMLSKEAGEKAEALKAVEKVRQLRLDNPGKNTP